MVELIDIIQNIKSSLGYRYQSKDNLGNSMDTTKIIENPGGIGGNYLCVYHTNLIVKIAVSNDLLNWTYKAIIDTNASQPTIGMLSNGGFVVIVEGKPGDNLRFYYYNSIDSLLVGNYEKRYDVTKSLSSCAEGTPCIYSVGLNNGSLSESIINIGFHYFMNCDVDRQAKGTLTGFSSFIGSVESETNSVISGLGVNGNIGDRDQVVYNGVRYTVHEGQLAKGDWSAWRLFLYNWNDKMVSKLNMITHKGSISLANPSITQLTLPDGSLGMVMTTFIFSEGSVSGESGELIYYNKIGNEMCYSPIVSLRAY